MPRKKTLPVNGTVITDLPNELRAAVVMHGYQHRLCVVQLEDPVTAYKLWLLDGATGALTGYAPLAFGPIPPATNSLVYMTVRRYSWRPR